MRSSPEVQDVDISSVVAELESCIPEDESGRRYCRLLGLAVTASLARALCGCPV